MAEAPIPTGLRLRKQSRLLELEYANGERYELPWEFLRVHSPSAEVRGHGPDQAVLQVGKRRVGISELRPVGHYAVQIVFDDGHDTGLYSWDYLHHLCREQASLWASYLQRLHEAGQSRDPDTQVLHFDP
jgi:DUF971 family protein